MPPLETIHLAPVAPAGASGENGMPRPVQIRTGISDGRNIEVIDGLKEGDQVIVGVVKEEASRERTVNPFAFGRRR